MEMVKVNYETQQTEVTGRLLIDWFSFSIKVDVSAETPFNGYLNMKYICNILGIPSENFMDCGRVKFYEAVYRYEDISIAVPFHGFEDMQGYLVTMTGSGCRFFEQYHHKTLYDTPESIWRKFFCKVRGLNARGLSINIPRFDVAVDDFTGVLNMGTIVDSVKKGEVVSLFRRRNMRDYFCNPTLQDCSILTSCDHGLVSQTVDFGSRRSNTYCRIYDKLLEQRSKNRDNPDELAKLEQLPSWVRVEFEFKNERAIMMVNAYCDNEDFPSVYAAYLNGVLRFVSRDDTNVSRCSVKHWWAKFVGTLRRIRLEFGDYKPITKARHMAYVERQLSGVIYTAINICGDVDSFLRPIVEHAAKKISARHRMLCEGIEFNPDGSSASDLWAALNPKFRELETLGVSFA